eukprot:839500-Amphidinium_carterae.1
MSRMRRGDNNAPYEACQQCVSAGRVRRLYNGDPSGVYTGAQRSHRLLRAPCTGGVRGTNIRASM